MREEHAVASAFRYFSIVPVGRSDPEPPSLYAIALLPIVGAFIGAVSGGAGMLAANVVEQPWPALVAFALALVLSGAIHVDGFLDCCDALFASVPPQRRLQILKDPRHGTYAVVGMFVLGAFWLSALQSIPPSRLLVTLTFSGALSRLCAFPVVLAFPHARTPLTQGPRNSDGTVAFALLAIAMLLGASLISPAAIATVLGAGVTALLVAWACAQRLNGGVTGDIFGAVIVFTEVTVLIALGLVRWR